MLWNYVIVYRSNVLVERLLCTTIDLLDASASLNLDGVSVKSQSKMLIMSD
jgi:hypothetical protein